jgi:hypothetical protein
MVTPGRPRTEMSRVVYTGQCVLQCAMLQQNRGHSRKPRYLAAPFKWLGGRAWMVCDDREGRMVAIDLPHQEARTLAHTLNVADLCGPAMDFEDDR